VVAAPDYAAAFVGWRAWLVVLVESEFRLCSPVYPTIWPPRQELRAICQGRKKSARRPGLAAAHLAPEERCNCGIYASNSAERAAQMLVHVHAREYEYPVEQPVFGRVSLWGKVVECERGWRASCAYPAALYVPALSEPEPSEPELRPLVARLFRSPYTHPDRLLGRYGLNQTPHPTQVARALEHYGVPIGIVSCQTLRQAAEHIALAE
jgi:hypothetical protein